MDLKARGIGRYFHEYMVHRAIEQYPAWRTGRGEKLEALRASQGRHVRDLVSQSLARRGATIDRLGPAGPAALMESIDEAMGQVFPDYRAMFPDAAKGAEQASYVKIKEAFGKYIGSRGHQPAGGVRLPVSPFDPRWAGRETVMAAGTKLLSIADADVRGETTAEDGLTKLDEVSWQGAFELMELEVDPDSRTGLPRQVGRAMTEADQAGLSALRPYMSAAEYREAAPWVLAGVREHGAMSPRALERSLAVMEYLGNSGIDYSIVPDRQPGQIAARIAGSRVTVRLTETAPNEAWVGRVYGDGVATYYSNKGGEGSQTYEATPEETVALVRFAAGQQVERLDGRGTIGVPGERSDAPRQAQSSYHVANGAMFEARPGLWIKRDASFASERVTWIPDAAAGEAYLREAIESAREGVTSAIGVDELISEAAANIADPDYTPDFSGLPDEIAALKAEYWQLLTDPDSEVLLLNPGVTATEYADAVIAGDDALARELTSAMDAGPYPQDKIAAHAAMVTDSLIGAYELDEQGLRFDPVRVSQYMSNEHNAWRNNDDITEACRKAGIAASELRGDDYYNKVVADNLIDFDETTAVDVADHPSPVIRGFGQRAQAAIARGAADVTSVRIDANGVMRWEAERRVGIDDNRTVNSKGEESGARGRYVTGTIGQLFDRGPNKEVVTKFAGGDNFLFMPGFEASVVAQKPGENLTLEQRTRIKGYEQVMGEAIDSTIARDISNPRSEVGRTTSLNGTVRRMAAHRHPVDFFDRSAQEGLSQSWRDAILETEARRVRYPTEIARGSSALKHRQATSSDRFDPLNDNTRDPLILTGMRNISVLDRQAGHGVFDPMMTGMADNQGAVRYLVPGARIAADGSIVPSDTPDARVPLASHPGAWAMGFDPHDRQNMSFSNAMQASSVVEGARTAMAQVGGWNFEDGIVVSADFARDHLIRATDGQMRPLTVGDKLSDLHGNKGVISLIVDREMDPEQAREMGLEQQVEMFQANPELEVVMSPFSPISRFNGGTAREMMQSPADLVMPVGDGAAETVPAGIGQLNLIVTHMAVDAKTNVYDAEAMAQGKGRKASSQLAWALQSQGAYEVMRQFYGSNTGGLADVREYLMVLGMDVHPDGTLSPEILPESLTERNVFTIEPMDKVYRKAIRESFGEKISRSGGLMELPFELRMADGATTPESPENPGKFMLPVLSAKLRSEQDMADGTVTRHDHTKRYMSIYSDAVLYLDAEQGYQEAVASGDKAKASRLAAKMDSYKADAQRAYNGLSADVVARRIESKTNVFKESVMSNRLSHSATAVWTGDPRLEVDQVAMNSAMAVELGVPMMTRAEAEAAGRDYVPGTPRDDGYVMLWRDPVLRDGAVRYMRVVIDDSLTGVAVNPVSVKSMDGDFDGDSVGLVGNLGPAAHAEAMAKLTVEANLLDKGQRVTLPVHEQDDEGRWIETGQTKEVFPLSLHTSLDVEVACKADPELKPFIEQMTVEANTVYEDLQAGRISSEEFGDRSRAIMRGLSGSVYHDAFNQREGLVALRFGDLQDHLESVTACYTRGGKGGPGKLKDYAQYLGADIEMDEAGAITRCVDVGAPDPEAFDEKYRGSQAATAFKTQITGIAGSISQNAIQLARAQGLVGQACEISYPATQSVLQAKHDPVDAAYRADIISGPAKDLWRGRLMEKFDITDSDGSVRLGWSPVRDDSGRPAQATRKQWTEQFMAMYADPKGMGVPVAREHVEAMAQALSDASGTMLNTERDAWQEWPEDKQPLTLDQLAYGGSLADLVAAAERGGGLFEGVNSSFAPTSAVPDVVMEAELARSGVELDQVFYEPIGRKDTCRSFVPRLPRSEWTASTRSAAMGHRWRPEVAGATPVAQVVPAHSPEMGEQASVGAERVSSAATQPAATTPAGEGQEALVRSREWLAKAEARSSQSQRARSTGMEVG